MKAPLDFVEMARIAFEEPDPKQYYKDNYTKEEMKAGFEMLSELLKEIENTKKEEN